ncbi:MAG: bifunctional folylpolyglutamate synthase/dihydrofolate synthase [Selenomonadaceae bacterium]|nr:bifunctional folylpolyglutamate synthase/dihydrofolate synthase [Selenomonadaceae bacterium]
MTYQEGLTYLEELAVFGVRLGLDRMTELLRRLDFPQNRYPTVHITGTNGKGSVAAMTAKILESAGLRTGLYTSPHLAAYPERIQIDGEAVSEADFAAGLGEIKKQVAVMVAQGEECPTQFEVLTALAFWLFAQRQVEYAVIEVGLGGLLDSTNVITPEVTVITNVTLEHADKCGGTLEGVARHKAGIIKDGVPVVTAARGEPLRIIKEVAAQKNTDVFVLGEDFEVTDDGGDKHGQRFRFTSKLLGKVEIPYEIHLLGTYQRENAALAVMTGELLHNSDERIDEGTIRKGLSLALWPGRFELIKFKGATTVIDGAHNPAGMVALRQSLDKYFPHEKRLFLLGILRDKDREDMLASLLRSEDKVIVTEPPSPRAAACSDVAATAKRITAEVACVREPIAALAKALEQVESSSPSILVITGSLYLVGAMREQLRQLND